MERRSCATRILVVDDDEAVVSWLVEMLEEQGYVVRAASSAEQALGLLEEFAPALVVCDVEMPGMRGIDFLRVVHERSPGVLVVLITAFGSIELALQSMRGGACDFLTKPFRIESLYHAIERALRERRMRREIVRLRSRAPDVEASGLAVASPAMQRVVSLLQRAARSDVPILLTGESGTGKGHLARYVQANSPRASGPFVHINCAALPAALVESELFGVRAGAFTDARQDRPGLFRQANGGTLFLDEIGELPIEVQPKLLSVLETMRVRPVGATEEIQVDTRVIAATNRPLEEAIEERRFRSDLFFRLDVVRVLIPPLRERKEDIDELVDLLLHRFAQRHGRELVGISADALAWIRSYHWPGNVRELANVLERAVALSDHDTIVIEDLVPPEASSDPRDLLGRALEQKLSLEELGRVYMHQVLASVDGNKSQAARWLGIDRRTLYRKLDGEPTDEADEGTQAPQ